MTEERIPYHIEQGPAIDHAHEHLYRVAFGNKIAIRFCERCGKAWLLQELRDLLQNRSVYEWGEVGEPGAYRKSLDAE